MEGYHLTKDDFDAIMELELLTGPNAKPALSGVSTAAKSALTRKYNAAHASKQFEAKKTSKQSLAAERAVARFTEDGEDEEGGAGEEEGDSDDDDAPPAAAAAASSSKAAAGSKAKPSAKGKGKAKA
jgi:hypothetical protein